MGAPTRRHPIEWPYGVVEAAPDLYSPRMGALSTNPLDGFDPVLPDPAWDEMERAGMRPWFDDPGF